MGDGEGRDAAPTTEAGTAALFAASTVLVVDDQEANVTLLVRLLQLAGFTEVRGLTDPRQVVDVCRSMQPDLIVLDLHMPHLDGFQVMEALHADPPPGLFPPILVLTADIGTEARDRALSAGAKDFLTKPFDRVEVYLRVANLLETRAAHRALARDNEELQRVIDEQLAEQRRQADERTAIVERIRGVIRDRRLDMVFQPVVDLRSGLVVGVEALARFLTEPRRPPNEWFDDAAAFGLDVELELAAVTAAIAQLPLLPPEMFMAVNLSPSVVLDGDLRSVFAQSDGRRIVLELTEHQRIDDYDALLEALDVLRYQGVRVAVDDAGAGYAGLSHILRLLPDILKMDLELIRDIDRDPVRRALAASLVGFAAEIGATIVAEGIETPAELLTLDRLGVPLGQGYHLARPGALPPPAVTVETAIRRTEGP
jgi:EAL domain-containing protein (putative c-di-GMP-specific phosphodiesterase class I)/AmiR/NasT family two-component response regulator